MVRDAELVVDDDITRAESLPAWTFFDPAFARRELETVFTRTWQLVPERGGGAAGEDARPLGELLAVRGARVPVTLNDRPIFLQRGWDDDALRAFPNACTHAWHPLVLGPSRGPTLVCPQHGRKFDCAGRFVAQAGFQDAPDFPRPCDHLQAWPVESWRRFLWVAPGPAATPLAAVLAPVEDSVARMPLETAAHRPQGVRELDGNWKQHAWNYMDRFHIGFIHRAPGGLADAVDMPSYTTELHPFAALQWVYAKDPAHGFRPELLGERFRDPARPERRVFALWWFVFPDVALSFYPWGLSLNVYQPSSENPERMLFHWHHYVMDQELYAQRDRVWLNDQIDREDVDAMSQVRRALRAGVAPRGRFAPREETGPHWFHRLVSRLVLEA